MGSQYDDAEDGVSGELQTRYEDTPGKFEQMSVGLEDEYDQIPPQSFAKRRSTRRTWFLVIGLTSFFFLAAAYFLLSRSKPSVRTRPSIIPPNDPPTWKLPQPADDDVPTAHDAQSSQAESESSSLADGSSPTVAEDAAWPLPTQTSSLPSTTHPIDRLIADASAAFGSDKLSHPSPQELAEAAAQYREKRGRHPPPGFDLWFAWAKEKDAVIEEWMFDQIYDDLEVFWSVEPSKIREDAASWPVVISIRNGATSRRRAMPDSWGARDFIWETMLNALPEGVLPDVDLPMSLDDTGHVFVPFETIDRYMEMARQSQVLKPAEEMMSTYMSYGDIGPATFTQFPDHPTESDIWLLTRDTCQPESTARSLVQDTDFTVPASFPNISMRYMSDGYISNWTAATRACENPDLRNLQGYFVNAVSGSNMHWKDKTSTDRLLTRTLFPVFASSKLAGSNNDILIPSVSDWGTNYFAEDSVPWVKKRSEVVWRGGATGGFNNDTNWTRFHRHRFISMLNSSQVSMAERSTELPEHVPGGEPPLPHNFPIPLASDYDFAALHTSHDLGRWTSTFANVSFTNLFCYPLSDWTKNNLGKTCSYTDAFYHSTDAVNMTEFFDAKYLPDIDGHGYSGRFRAFLMSNSLPIKATMWQEWSTQRLKPWVHFVPMDGTFIDWWGLMDYFIGYSPPEGTDGAVRKGHDEVAEKIAQQGKEWASKVLRHEDMLIYAWRLILEYARICDDYRDRLGYVGDLL